MGRVFQLATLSIKKSTNIANTFIMKKLLKKIAIGLIYAIVFIPNFIIGFANGLKSKE